MGITSFGSGRRLTLLGAMALSVATVGCGGGGDSSSSAPGTQLAFAVNWEQPSAAIGSIAASSAAEPLAFDTPIPPSVNAVRFILRPQSGSDCCIAVLRGSQAFIDRRILLAAVTPGDTTLEVNGYPTDFAPADGVTTECATSDGEGTACEGDEETLPSFGSDEIAVDVVAGIRNVVNVDVHSLPFLVDLDPEDGETADSERPEIRFTVADANFGIEIDSLDVHVQGGEVDADAGIVSTSPCSDDDSELPDCSPGGALDVQGIRVVALSPAGLEPGSADLTIEASNLAEPSRSMQSETTFVVPGDVTTSTTITTTTITSTTSTTETTTTTLDGGLEQFCIEFRLTNASEYVGLAYTVSYASTGGDFVGSGEDVDCELVLDANPETTLASFNDDDTEGNQLFTAIISGDSFSGPVTVARCAFEQVPPLVLSNFAVQVTEATAPDLSPISANVIPVECPL